MIPHSARTCTCNASDCPLCAMEQNREKVEAARHAAREMLRAEKLSTARTVIQNPDLDCDWPVKRPVRSVHPQPEPEQEGYSYPEMSRPDALCYFLLFVAYVYFGGHFVVAFLDGRYGRL